MRRIIKREIAEEIYVSEDGKETPVRNMYSVHLLNALIVAVRDENKETLEALKAEVIRRMAE